MPVELAYPVMSIGIFDGVHRGHQKILKRLVERAGEKQGVAVVLTFFPHPRKVISSVDAPPLLQTWEQKEKLLDGLAVDILVRLPFTRNLSLCSPEEFSRKILGGRGIEEIHVGSNFRFGHRRTGNVGTLKALGRELGFDVYEIGPVQFREDRISSTSIRKALQLGKVELVKRLLGRPYQVLGTVIRGAGQGGPLGFRTANLDTENELVPAEGVYATRTYLNGQEYASVTNIGYRPTLHRKSSSEPVVETHLLDFTDKVYGQHVKLDFYLRLRAEKKFRNVEQLKQQIKKDIRETREYWVRIQKIAKE